MFVWDVLKHGVPESVQFCIDDLPMYIFSYQPIPSLHNRRHCTTTKNKVPLETR